MNCGYGHGECKAPDTQCPYWQGTFCELDKEAEEQEAEREQYLLSPALYQAYVDIVDKFDKEVREHPENIEEVASKYYEQFVNVKDVALGDRAIMRDCHKCVYEVGCHESPLGCKKYKRDAPDGGYYG